ncbi:MAG: MFS transporter, partial [Pseudomonadota bacterium]
MQGKKSNRVIVAGITGNVLEWYDFAVYGFFAPILARLFFPSEDPTVSLIAAYGAFAAGFLMRPLGAALFGHVGDRYGRKKALMLSIIMMAIPSLAIGFLPTYDQIGILAAVLLVILRMLQGVAVGGEYTTSIVYLSETAPADRRGYFSSWAMSGANGGILLGSLIGAGLSFLITDAQLQSWGWRVPFLLGVLVAASAFFLRRRMDDSKSTERLSFPLGHVIKHHWRKVVHIICLNAGFAVAYYIGFVYVSGWLVSEMHETHAEAMTINSIAIASMFVLVPLLARLSDRVGRRPLLITGAALVTLLVHPLGWVMAQPDPAYA